jgi:hypothetical protein
MKEKFRAAPSGRPKISHQEILKTAIDYTGFADLYRQQVLTQQTRTIRLLGRKCPAKIIHTLLGFEVQACYKRIQCPDMVTARYLRLFSEIGCHSIKLPYDPTRTAQIIPEFEAMMDRIARRIRERFPQDRRAQQYVFQKVFAILRRQLQSA